MKVLIGGEHNGVIRDAFIDLGHDAMSCDFRPSKGNHYQGDWWDVIGDGWDLGIFHPTCTFMSNSGAKHLYLNCKKEHGLNVGRWVELGKHAWAFWDLINRCPIPRFAIENPVMIGYAQKMIGKPTQTIQPWWFADDENGPDNVKKQTCLWLFGMPKLERTGTVDGSTARDECHKQSPTKDPEERRMKRSVTTPGIAKAMADQWGNLDLANVGEKY